MSRTARPTTPAVALALVAATGLGAAPPASAEPAAITSATLSWSQANLYDAAPARTFLGHTTRPGLWSQGRSNGTAVAADGATIIGPAGEALSEVGPGSARGASAIFTVQFPGATGTIDRAARTTTVQTSGSLTYAQYPALQPVPPAPITLSRLRVELGPTSGSVYADIAGPSGANTGADQPVFSLSTANAQVLDLPGGRTVISGLAPTIQRADIFGSAEQYPVGIAGPDRPSNTFGTFALTIDTGAAPPVTERVVERPVDRIVERVVTLERLAAAGPATQLRSVSLARTPFSATQSVEVDVAPAGVREVLGRGVVLGRRLWVVVPTGTPLAGRYRLRRTSSAKRLPRTATVTVRAARPTTTTPAAR